MFVNRISELVKHTLQQLASLHSPEAYVNAVMTITVYSSLLLLQDFECDECKWNPFNSKLHTRASV